MEYSGFKAWLTAFAALHCQPFSFYRQKWMSVVINSTQQKLSKTGISW